MVLVIWVFDVVDGLDRFVRDDQTDSLEFLLLAYNTHSLSSKPKAYSYMLTLYSLIKT